MAKISKNEFLSDISNIIEENMNPEISKDNSKKFLIRKHLLGLLEAGQRDPKLMSYLNRYDKLIKQPGVKEYMIYEQFGNGLTNFDSNKAVKAVIEQMNSNLEENGEILKFYTVLEQVADERAKAIIKECYDNCIACSDYESRNNLIDAIDALSDAGDPVGQQLIIVLTGGKVDLPELELGTTESKFDEIQKKLKEEAERRKMQEIQRQVDEYANKVFAEAQAEEEAAALASQEANCFDAVINTRGLNLRESIKAIANSDAASNARLMDVLEQYAGAINQGLYEERLYEGFTRNLSQFSYLAPVEKELERINEVAEKNGISIELTKLLEEMSTTSSYYLVPIIEESVCTFINTPSDTNRSQARAILLMYAHDPYCRAMIEAIENNMSAGKTLTDAVLSMQDKLNVLKENAIVSNVYSPIQYIKDGECVFNANGQFFVKKGNTLATLSDEYLSQLSESFVSLCQLVNDPHVYINDDADDSIVLIGTNKVANIYEGYATINGNRETIDTLRNLTEMSIKYDFDNNFFIMASCLLENFNKIAKVDFAKHIQLNENAGINVDIFRLNNSIFINAVNEDMNQETFYQNVNPLQCRNIINRHMGLNVAALFEDLLPSQDKIIMHLNEAKEGYEAAIDKYESTIEKLKTAKESCTNEDNAKKLDDAIESAEAKLEELKKEYKEWQKQVETEVEGKASKEDKEDDNIEVEPSAEPIDAKDVEDAKPDLLEPLTTDDEEANEADPVADDDEMADFLDAKDDEESEIESEDAEAEDAEDAEVESEDDIELPAADPTDDDAFDPESEEAGEDDGFSEIAIENEPEEDEEIIAPEEDDINIELPAEDNDGDFIDDESEQQPAEADISGYKIVNIAFDQNIKTNKIYRSGSVIVISSQVDENGRIFTTSETINFYVDEHTNLPILNVSNIPVTVYNAIVDAIVADSNFESVINSGIATDNDEETPANIYIDAKAAKAESDEIEDEDENLYFDIKDEDGELTISAKEEEETPAEDEEEISDDMDIFIEDEEDEDIEGEEEISDDMMKDIFTEDEEDEDEAEDEDDEELAVEIFGDEKHEKDAVHIPTYKSKDGKTDIELPAPSTDDTEIKEGSFFVGEGATKPSKKEVSASDLNKLGIIKEYAEPTYTGDAVMKIHDLAEELAIQNEDVYVSDVATEDHLADINFKTFLIGSYTELNAYAIYSIDGKVFYRNADELAELIRATQNDYIDDIKDTLESYADGTQLDYVDADSDDDIAFMLEAIFNDLGIDTTVETDDVNESVKIRRPSLSSKGDINKSKLQDEAVNGTEEDKAFQEKVEKEAAKADIPNPLVASDNQQESVQPSILPNVHNALTESEVKEIMTDIIYEPMDWVIIKATGMKAQVQTLVTNGDGDITMLNVLASDGINYSCNTSDIEPDPLYLENLPGRTMNSQNAVVPKYGEQNIDPKTRLPKKLENDPQGEHADLNGKYVPVYVTVFGKRITMNPDYAVLADIAASKKSIRVVNENNETYEYDINKNLEFEDMPYAVIVDSDEKPVRRIKVDPMSYVNAADDEMVICSVDDKITTYPKCKIKILS